MDSKQFEELDGKINVLIGLLTLSLTQNQTLQERAYLLNSLGLGPTQIAKILGKTKNNIDNALHEVRQKKKES